MIEGEKPRIHIEVKDTGVGISNEDISKIFKPFALSHQDLHGQMGGSGVGLTIARAIVENIRELYRLDAGNRMVLVFH